MEKDNKDIDITPEEMEKIHQALKDEKFRDMFFDYCKEISDPENRAKYEQEITQLEMERGYNVTFVKPEAGHVVKVIDENQNKKVFINVCTSTTVDKAASDGGNRQKGSSKGESWTIPHVIQKPREDSDKAGKSCVVCDVVFHPDVYNRAKTQPSMMKMLNDIALDSVRDKFGMKLDRNNVKYPKLKFKGRQEASIIRNKTAGSPVENLKSEFVKYPEPAKDRFDADKELLERQSKKVTSSGLEQETSCTRTKPRYKILHRGHFDLQNFTLARDFTTSTRPAELCIEIELPMARSAAGVDLDVFEKQLVLDSKKPDYYLDVSFHNAFQLSLPYPVDEDKGKAQFDKSRKVLIVTLPVLSPKIESSMHKMNAKEDDSHCGADEDAIDETDIQRHCDNQYSDTSGTADCNELGNTETATYLAVGDIDKDNNKHSQSLINNESTWKQDSGGYNSEVGKEEVTSVSMGTETTLGVVEPSNQPRSDDGHSNEMSPGELENGIGRPEKAVNAETNNNFASYSSVLGENLEFSKPRDASCNEILMNNQNSNPPEKNGLVNSGQKISESGNDDVFDEQSEEDSKSNHQTNGNNIISGSSEEINSDLMGGVAEKSDSIGLEFANLPNIAGMYKVPPFDYDQDEKSISVNINIANVKMENVSLGFSSRKVYFSVSKQTDGDSDADSDCSKWCLVMKFMEYCHLESDSCTIDVEAGRVVLLLQKAEDSFGLWNKFYAGSSDKDLEEQFFFTDHSMSEIFVRLRGKSDPWAKKHKEIEANDKEEENANDFATRQLEASLEQLLKAQSHQSCEISTENAKSNTKDSLKSPEASFAIESTSSSRSETDSENIGIERSSSNDSDLMPEICMDDLQDDVVFDTATPPASYVSRPGVLRSYSDETPSRRPRSILKGSRSESTSEESDGTYSEAPRSIGEHESYFPVDAAKYMCSSVRIRSQSFTMDTRSAPPRGRGSMLRNRNKSVSFDLEPKVCEFVEYSKKQLKKMRKQERKQTELQAKKNEALAKAAKGGKSKGKSKGGRNRNFLNGFRRDNSIQSCDDVQKTSPDESKVNGEDSKPENRRSKANDKELKVKECTNAQDEQGNKEKAKRKDETLSAKEMPFIESENIQKVTHESTKIDKPKNSSKKDKNGSINVENAELKEKSNGTKLNLVNALIYELDD
eukprot:gene4607-5213_t